MLTSRQTISCLAIAMIVGVTIASPGSEYGRANCGHIAMSDVTACQACCDMGITNGDIGMESRKSCHKWCEARQKWATPGPAPARIVDWLIGWW